MGRIPLNLSYNTLLTISWRSSLRAISNNYANNSLIRKGACRSTTLQYIYLNLSLNVHSNLRFCISGFRRVFFFYSRHFRWQTNKNITSYTKKTQFIMFSTQSKTGLFSSRTTIKLLQKCRNIWKLEANKQRNSPIHTSFLHDLTRHLSRSNTSCVNFICFSFTD